MNEERLPRKDLYIAPETYLHRQQLMRERFDHMIAYAMNEERCRSEVLETYFGGGETTPCGVCDICLARKKAARLAVRSDEAKPRRSPDATPHRVGNAPVDLESRILECLERGITDPRQIAAEMACPPERYAEAIRRLLDSGTVRTTSGGRLERTAEGPAAAPAK